MKKFIAASIALVLLLAALWAAGPFWAVRGIRAAIEENDSAALSRHVDFPAVRSSLKAQADDYMARRAGEKVRESVLGAFALSVASNLSGAAIETMATPVGVGALLQGRSLWHRTSRDSVARNDIYKDVPARDPFQDARYRFESLSRFKATLVDDEGEEIDVTMTRHGLRWKISDIDLRLGEDDDAP
ncbi:DUF2939 domain-containing protein [Marilutibacter aestuarii]|uniref:DUF2939 domain-containing protein n=1 Tax=Marilutibacter aestuarii TaxID=1706195 RepID=A0A508A1F5_9GAMM|nr:DUF2939 domain-containing protein [Lysobacter aestuarii]TQD42553.1 DUF2939 domain-containing protein [Lysobacter aestuarii]